MEEGEDLSFFFLDLLGEIEREATDVPMDEEESRPPAAAAAAVILLISLEAPIMSTRASIIAPLWSNICFFK